MIVLTLAVQAGASGSMARMLVATALLALLAGCVAAEDWSLQDVSRRVCVEALFSLIA